MAVVAEMREGRGEGGGGGGGGKGRGQGVGDGQGKVLRRYTHFEGGRYNRAGSSAGSLTRPASQACMMVVAV